jgi:O-methyltransferase
VNGETAEDPVALLHKLLLGGRPAARDSMAAVREARASRPGANANRLRTAYLDLLKLCLCDLAGTTTISVGSMPGGRTASRVLRDDDLKIRAVGLDWPLQGLTMTGLQRLDDLQSCVESVVREGVEGDVIEAGAWRGGSSILMRATLDTLDDSERTVWVADSFKGFPAEAGEQIELSTYDFLAVPLEQVKANFARFGLDDGVRFVPGFFEDTLPSLADGRWAIVRLDGDTYEATMTTLEWLYPGLVPGGYLILDDYGALEECSRAVDDFRERHGITDAIERIDWTGARWRRESTSAIEPPARRREPPPRAGTASASGAPYVPSVRELRLEEEVAELRERLAEAERGARRGIRLLRR